MWYYLIGINVLAFLLYGIDKAKAKRGAWRIAEKVLLGIGILGGALGALAGAVLWVLLQLINNMYLFVIDVYINSVSRIH